VYVLVVLDGQGLQWHCKDGDVRTTSAAMTLHIEHVKQTEGLQWHCKKCWGWHEERQYNWTARRRDIRRQRTTHVKSLAADINSGHDDIRQKQLSHAVSSNQCLDCHEALHRREINLATSCSPPMINSIFYSVSQAALYIKSDRTHTTEMRGLIL